jgi:2-polyprenyl-3-methyl-5-hydroxy-6-metoxy-1,4-benzoquinol methylase
VIRDNSDASWEKWGNQNPYYAVLTDNKFRRENLSNEAKSEFFESGRVQMERVLAIATRHLGVMDCRQSALDFGCGVGRLLIPLAQVFDHVTGLDISPTMLGITAENCAERGIENVDFVLSDDELTRVKGKFDFIHSYIVLQHVPSHRGEAIIKQMIGRLSPGGILAIHFPLMRRASVVRKSVNFLRRNFAPLSVLANIVQRRPWNEPFMQMHNYDANRILVSLAEHGMKHVFWELIDSGGFLSAYAFARNS